MHISHQKVIRCHLQSVAYSDARRLTAKEIRMFGNTARAIAIIMLIVYLILVALGRYEIAFPVGAGIILPAGLQLPALIRKLFTNRQRGV